MTVSNRSILIAIGSEDFFGAERRFMKIIRKIGSLYPEIKVFILINSSLYTSSKKNYLANDIIQAAKKDGRLAVVPDKPGHLLQWINPLLFFRLMFSRSVAFHVILRARALAYVRAALGLAVTIEVTSPDIARRIPAEVPGWILGQISNFLCVSPSVEKRLRETAIERGVHIADSQISVASACYFEPVETSQDLVVKEKILVSASRFIPRKNVVALSKAIAKVADKLPDWKFALFGKGPDEDEIKSNVAQLVERGQVIVGYVPDVGAWLERSSVYASVIQPDNYPSQSVLEAMFLGNALLLTNSGDSVERFLGGDNGVSVEVPIDDVQLAATLLKLCSDHGKTVEMGKASREVCLSRYSPERFVNEMLGRHGLVEPGLAS